MAPEENLINFDIIENQKENIQSLPQGRSAKALASAFGPTPFSPVPTPGSTRNLNDAIRIEYEKELADIGDSDDPLDIYDRYVKWTLNAYPSAQATPESQLRPLLERATKAFQSSTHYKNDPRYLRLWMHYIRFFSDAPREAFAYLARHNIGEGLALFYEEFASWLEGAGRWAQAEEVYQMGIEREARPIERLLRKFGEYRTRFEARPQGSEGPSSPALPTLRPALAAKVDPFASTARSADPQAQRLPSQSTASRSGRQKLAIFSDAGASDAASRPGSGDASRGWDNIGTIEERKKENVIGAKPWVGETLKAGKKTSGAPKMMIFKDESVPQASQTTDYPPSAISAQQQSVNPRTGKIERVFVNLEAVYPNPANIAEEYSFEELRASSRGWFRRDWKAERLAEEGQRDIQERSSIDLSSTVPLELQEDATLDDGGDQTLSELTLGGSLKPRERKSGRSRRKKVMEVRGETQTVAINLDSPTSKPKMRRKSTREPTMTLHTKAANEDILDIFNQPLRNIGQLGADHDSASESDFDDEDYTGYTSAGDSTGTGGASAPASEFGDDDTTRSAVPAENTGLESVSPWSDFTKSKHMPKLEGLNLDDKTSDQAQDTHDNVENQTPHIQEFSEDSLDHRTQKAFSEQELEASIESQSHEDPYTKRISIPPEDYEAPTHPFRDAAQMAQNRLPFMTPIVEQTESSIPSVRPQKDYFSAKTPSRKRDVADPALPHIDDLLIGSPFKLAANEAGQGDDNSADSVKTVAVQAHSIPKSIDPIIQDRQCNPVDETIRKTILERIEPPLTTFEGFYDHSLTTFNRGAEIRKFVKAITKVKGAEKTSTSLSLPPILHFPDSGEPPYTIKRELGKGAFAPVYLASASSEPTPSLSSSISSFHTTFVAIKAELPPNPWEFYILRLAHDRLLTSMFQAHSRAAASLASPTSFHLFADEAYLLESYHDQGTLLDLANLARADAAATGAQAGACDETVAVYFAAELLRCLEALHAVGILHGDIKADNFLVRLDPVADNDWDAVYRADGTGGWSSKGIALIDFGRGVDMRAFVDGVQFIADWKTTKLDCPEMREMRPWTFQADYWGAAGVLHVLLYGKWIEDVLEKGGPAEGGDSSTDGLVGNRTKRHRLKESFKRYWQTELWGAVFDVLMNPMVWVEGEENGCLPVTRRLSEVRAICERWLEENAEKRGLKGQLKRYEERLRAGKRA